MPSPTSRAIMGSPMTSAIWPYVATRNLVRNQLEAGVRRARIRFYLWLSSAVLFHPVAPAVPSTKTRHYLRRKKLKAAQDGITREEAIAEQEEHFIGADLLGKLNFSRYAVWVSNQRFRNTQPKGDAPFFPEPAGVCQDLLRFRWTFGHDELATQREFRARFDRSARLFRLLSVDALQTPTQLFVKDDDNRLAAFSGPVAN